MRILITLTLVAVLVSVTGAQERIARADRTKMRETRETMRSLHLDLTTYQQVHGDYPAELKSLINSKLREEIPKDAWGRDFQYTSDEDDFRLVSLGADGKPGGKLADADIVFTVAGETRELTEDERAELLRKLEENRYQANRVLARKRMTVIGSEVVNHRRENGAWPKSLDDCRREGEDEDDAAVNACFQDPFGHGFVLRLLPHDNFAVICWGADGKEGGQGRDSDFVITEREVRAGYNSYRNFWGYDPWGNDWQIESLANDVQRYKDRFGRLPDELNDLTRGGAGPDGPLQPIRSSIPEDRWGNAYVLIKAGDDEFYVVGLGKDGIEGGVKDNKDIIHPVPGQVRQEPDYWDEPAVPMQDDDEVLYEIAEELLRDIVEKVNAHHAAEGSYPASLADIAEAFPGGDVPLDPWDTAFKYELTKDADGTVTGFSVTCLGSDGAPGGAGWAADITLDQDGSRAADDD
jgi:general secretion pathway protein G